MKCKFCAEDIQDSAILCRYCGATLDGSEWIAPSSVDRSNKKEKKRGVFTIKFSAFLLVASAIFELMSPYADVAFLGNVQQGNYALAYHLTSAGFFGLAGFGLLEFSQRGLKAFYALVVFYTIQQVIYIFDESAILSQLAQSREIQMASKLIDTSLLVDTLRATSAVMVLSMSGFALYIYFRRHLFK